MRSIITISRQYGSGGRYVGKLLSEKLQIPYYDKEILTLAAKESGFSESLIEAHNEKTARSLLFAATPIYPSQGLVGGDYMGLPLNHSIFLAQFDAIRRIASEGPCIIIGRCADYVLKDDPDAAHIFIRGSLASRIERAVTHYGVDRDKAEDLITKADKQRSGYYQYYTSSKWARLDNYHLCVDTGAIGVENATELIAAFIQMRENIQP